MMLKPHWVPQFLLVNTRRILCISLVSMGLSACDDPSKIEDEAPVLRFVKVLEITDPALYQFKEFPGVVDATQKAELAFRVSGKLEKLLVKEGESVQKGQLIAQLDATDYLIQLNSREAEYKQVHADYLRGQTLVGSGVLSRSDFNKLEAKNATAGANLASAKQTVGYSSLHAPFAGQVAKRFVENFEDVASMQPIYLLQDMSSLTIKVNIPASLMIQTRDKNPPKLRAFFNEIPDQDFPLTIKEVSSQADEASNTYQVTLNMEAVSGYNVLPGMAVTVRGRKAIEQDNRTDVFYVPTNAVLGDENGQYVYLAMPSKDGLANVEQRRVNTGSLSSAGLEIVSGLTKGDLLVVAGMSKMYQGLEVRLNGEYRH